MSSPSFFEKHRTSLIAAALAVGASGVALYYLSTQNDGAADGSSSSEGTPLSPKDKEKAKKKKAKKRAQAKKNSPKSHGFNTTQESADAPFYPLVDDFAKVKALPENERKEIGDEFKAAGNFAFNSKQNELAIDLYDSAIEAFDGDAVYYSNRAAVYGLMGEFQKVIDDATKALELRPDYVKCFSRRGVAYEKLGNYSDAVMDFTAACILANFQDENLGRAVDRVLKLKAEEVVEEKFGKTPSNTDFPSPTFVSAYLSAFHKRKLPENVEANTDEASGDYSLKLAFDAIDKENLESYKQAYEHLQEAIKRGLSTQEAEALTLEFLATFKFLLNDIAGALKDINRAIEIAPSAPAMIKRSSLLVELGELDGALKDFQSAEALDPLCADTQYQLAQLAFLKQDWPTAVDSYERAIELDSSFMLAYIQLAVTKYRMGEIEVAKRKFQKMIADHPRSSQAHNYYGEILLDVKDVPAAIKEFDTAIELEKEKSVAAINVLPLINKALALAQAGTSPKDLETAVELCRKAVAIDPLSDVAIGTLAQFCLQQGQTREAIELFERNAELARSRPEQVQAITFAEAAKTQFRIANERPILRDRIEILSRYGQPSA